MSSKHEDTVPEEGSGASPYVWLIYAFITIYSLTYQLQKPVEPFLVDNLIGKDKGSASAVAYANLHSAFSIIQMVGSLVAGYFIDRFGVRPVFMVNFLACAASYYILSITDSINMLYFSKIPGLAMCGFLCAQTAVVRLTPPGTSRMTTLGRLTTSYTVGGVIGPYVGGLLGSQGDYFIGAQVATVVALVAAPLAFLLPAHVDVGEKVNTQEKTEATKIDNAPRLQRIMATLSIVGLYLATKVITSIANSMARSSQPLILKNDLGCDEAMMGFIMSAQFAFGGFATTFLLGPMAKILGGKVSIIVRNCIGIMGCIYYMLGLVMSGTLNMLPSTGHTRHYAFLGFCWSLSIFQYSLGTSITTETTSLVPKEMQGTLMGIEHSLFAIAYAIGPNLGVAVLEWGGIPALGAVCGSIFMAVLAMLLVAQKSTNNDKSDEVDPMMINGHKKEN